MKIILIIPYFGTFPDYFQLFLNSCAENKGFEWMIFTDNKESFQYPNNVKRVRMRFEELKERIQKKFDFPISLKTPHKLCEYKPAYGYIFEEYIEEYDFWGYCDLDVIYGHLNHFINESLLEKYDKLCTLGHFTLIKNTWENNRMFMADYEGKPLYRICFSDEKNYNFDEQFQGKPNINDLFRKNGKAVFDGLKIADIYTKSSDFRLTYEEKEQGGIIVEKKSKNYFLHAQEGLFRRIKKEKGWVQEEYAYLHLQKRKMGFKGSLTGDEYLIVPNKFVGGCAYAGERDNEVKTKYFNMQYWKIRFRNLKVKIKEFRCKN